MTSTCNERILSLVFLTVDIELQMTSVIEGDVTLSTTMRMVLTLDHSSKRRRQRSED